jgi:hypothetical protein
VRLRMQPAWLAERSRCDGGERAAIAERKGRPRWQSDESNREASSNWWEGVWKGKMFLDQLTKAYKQHSSKSRSRSLAKDWRSGKPSRRGSLAKLGEKAARCLGAVEPGKQTRTG